MYWDPQDIRCVAVIDVDDGLVTRTAHSAVHAIPELDEADRTQEEVVKLLNTLKSNSSKFLAFFFTIIFTIFLTIIFD